MFGNQEKHRERFKKKNLNIEKIGEKVTQTESMNFEIIVENSKLNPETKQQVNWPKKPNLGYFTNITDYWAWAKIPRTLL